MTAAAKRGARTGDAVAPPWVGTLAEVRLTEKYEDLRNKIRIQCVDRTSPADLIRISKGAGFSCKQLKDECGFSRAADRDDQ